MRCAHLQTARRCKQQKLAMVQEQLMATIVASKQLSRRAAFSFHRRRSIALKKKKRPRDSSGVLPALQCSSEHLFDAVAVRLKGHLLKEARSTRPQIAAGQFYRTIPPQDDHQHAARYACDNRIGSKYLSAAFHPCTASWDASTNA